MYFPHRSPAQSGPGPGSGVRDGAGADQGHAPGDGGANSHERERSDEPPLCWPSPLPARPTLQTPWTKLSQADSSGRTTTGCGPSAGWPRVPPAVPARGGPTRPRSRPLHRPARRADDRGVRLPDRPRSPQDRRRIPGTDRRPARRALPALPGAGAVDDDGAIRRRPWPGRCPDRRRRSRGKPAGDRRRSTGWRAGIGPDTT